MNTKEGRQAKRLASVLFGFALLGIAARLLFGIIYSHARPESVYQGRFGDQAMGHLLGAIICTFLIPALVMFGQKLVRAGSTSHVLRLPGWIMAGLTVVFLMVQLFFVVYSFRPVPKYDPQNYQHLVGQHLRDARAELDTKHSGSGAVYGNGTYCRFLSFRGMEILANPDGVILEVKKGLRD